MDDETRLQIRINMHKFLLKENPAAAMARLPGLMRQNAAALRKREGLAVRREKALETNSGKGNATTERVLKAWRAVSHHPEHERASLIVERFKKEGKPRSVDTVREHVVKLRNEGKIPQKAK